MNHFRASNQLAFRRIPLSGCYLGEWKVGKESFLNKPMALIRAGELGKTVTYHYYDEIFDSVNTKSLGLISLPDLYRERALQLRESYDHLILYYSGGADSRNVLMTFIENNIKIDTITVKWPMKTVGKGIYPITSNPNSINFMCEWDLVIKPDLEWISQNHPEIDIEIIDWLDDLSESSFKDRAFDDVQQFSYMTNILRNPSCSHKEQLLVDKGKKVASIYGIEKPVFWLSESGEFYFLFTDTASTVNPPRLHNPTGTEYFYWTPDMPSIVYEQCFHLMKWFENQKQHRHLAKPLSNASSSNMTREEMNARWMQQNEITKRVIYPGTYRNVFQADKPLRSTPNFIGNTKDYYLETHPRLAGFKKIWKHHWEGWMQQFDQRFYDEFGWIHPIRSKPFLVGKISN